MQRFPTHVQSLQNLAAYIQTEILPDMVRVETAMAAAKHPGATPMLSTVLSLQNAQYYLQCAVDDIREAMSVASGKAPRTTTVTARTDRRGNDDAPPSNTW